MRQVAQYSLLETFHKGEFQEIYMAISSERENEVALVNEIDKNGPISQPLFDKLVRNLTNIVLYKNEAHYTLVTLYNEGVPFNTYIANYTPSDEKSLNLLHELLMKISDYDSLPKEYISVLIDANQIIINDENVFLNEIIILDKCKQAQAFHEKLKVIVQKLLKPEKPGRSQHVLDYFESDKFKNNPSLKSIFQQFKSIYLSQTNEDDPVQVASQEQQETASSSYANHLNNDNLENTPVDLSAEKDNLNTTQAIATGIALSHVDDLINPVEDTGTKKSDFIKDDYPKSENTFSLRDKSKILEEESVEQNKTDSDMQQDNTLPHTLADQTLKHNEIKKISDELENNHITPQHIDKMITDDKEDTALFEDNQESASSFHTPPPNFFDDHADINIREKTLVDEEKVTTVAPKEVGIKEAELKTSQTESLNDKGEMLVQSDAKEAPSLNPKTLSNDEEDNTGDYAASVTVATLGSDKVIEKTIKLIDKSNPTPNKNTNANQEKAPRKMAKKPIRSQKDQKQRKKLSIVLLTLLLIVAIIFFISSWLQGTKGKSDAYNVGFKVFEYSDGWMFENKTHVSDGHPIKGFVWTVEKDDQVIYTTQEEHFGYRPSQDGDYTITLKVVDEEGNLSEPYKKVINFKANDSIIVEQPKDENEQNEKMDKPDSENEQGKDTPPKITLPGDIYEDPTQTKSGRPSKRITKPYDQYYEIDSAEGIQVNKNDALSLWIKASDNYPVKFNIKGYKDGALVYDKEVSYSPSVEDFILIVHAFDEGNIDKIKLLIKSDNAHVWYENMIIESIK